MTETQKTIIRYRLERSYEALTEAKLLHQHGHNEACINRLYYACFYAATAILLNQGLSASTHSGLKTLFHQHITKQGIVNTAHTKLYNDLFLFRQRSDYEDKFRIDEHKIQPWIESTGEFIMVISRILQIDIAG